MPMSPFFFFNDPAAPEIYTLSLHDALPIFGRDRFRSRSDRRPTANPPEPQPADARRTAHRVGTRDMWRPEEHTSELQSQSNLVCRLLLEKKKGKICRGPTRRPAHPAR